MHQISSLTEFTTEHQFTSSQIKHRLQNVFKCCRKYGKNEFWLNNLFDDTSSQKNFKIWQKYWYKTLTLNAETWRMKYEKLTNIQKILLHSSLYLDPHQKLMWPVLDWDPDLHVPTQTQVKPRPPGGGNNSFLSINAPQQSSLCFHRVMEARFSPSADDDITPLSWSRFRTWCRPSAAVTSESLWRLI